MSVILLYTHLHPEAHMTPENLAFSNLRTTLPAKPTRPHKHSVWTHSCWHVLTARHLGQTPPFQVQLSADNVLINLQRPSSFKKQDMVWQITKWSLNFCLKNIKTGPALEMNMTVPWIQVHSLILTYMLFEIIRIHSSTSKIKCALVNPQWRSVCR